MANKKAIVTGSTGQDGSYMYELLESKGYDVLTPCRNVDLQRLIAEIQPYEIYNFAGISDVIHPYDSVAETLAVNIGLPANILESITKYSPHTKFFQASSCLAIESKYPYGVSKNAADKLIKQYRQEYGIYACSGILYPHESPRRKDHFFTKKVINAIKNKEHIRVGNLNVYREFGYAPEYVEAAWLMLQQNKPKDYEIGTGELILLRHFLFFAYDKAGLSPDYFVSSTNSQKDIIGMQANTYPIFLDLGWKAKTTVEELIKIMLK